MTCVLIEFAGAPIHAANYDPYGQIIEHYAPGASNLGFTGEYTDPSGLQYLRARYYDPTTAMFLSRDPVQGIMGISNSYNGYNYAFGNPVNLTDPAGTCPFCGAGISIPPLSSWFAKGARQSSRQLNEFVQTHWAGTLAASVLYEPLDWAITLNAWANGDFHILDVAGLLPLIPGAARRTYNAVSALRHGDNIAIASFRYADGLSGMHSFYNAADDMFSGGGRQADDWIDAFIRNRRAVRPDGVSPEDAVQLVTQRLKETRRRLRIGQASISVLRVDDYLYLGISADLGRKIFPDGKAYYDELQQGIRTYSGFAANHAESVALNEYYRAAIIDNDMPRARRGIADMFTNREPCGDYCLMDVDFRGANGGSSVRSQVVAGVDESGLRKLYMSFDLNTRATNDPRRFQYGWAEVTPIDWYGYMTPGYP